MTYCGQMSANAVRDAGPVWSETTHGLPRNLSQPDKTKFIEASFPHTGHFVFLPPLHADPIAQVDSILDMQCVYKTMTFPLLKLFKCREGAFPQPIASAPNKPYRV